ncbi:MAG: hypothetical protein AB7O44_12395 [Hyphomicrobiaceae bacterium]
MPTMLQTPNLTDVALVDPQNLAVAMQHMIATGRGLAMLRGIGKDELREVDTVVAAKLAHDPAERLAVLVRFRCLIEVFRARRLADLLLNTGYNLIAPAVHVAARQRLNADRGFNPVMFERALLLLLAKIAAGQRGEGVGLAA